METLRELVDKAHALGIKVIQDQVANHVGAQHPWVKDPPLDDWFHGTFATHVRNPFRADLLLSPHAHTEARRPTLDGWFSDDLPDMNQERARGRALRDTELALVGRHDRHRRHPSGHQSSTCRASSYATSTLRSTDSTRRCGWSARSSNEDPIHTSFFIGGQAGWDGIDTRMDSVFDFPAWDVSRKVFTGKMPAAALRYVLRADSLYPDPSRLVTMANNHDTSRFMSLEGATLEGAMLHVAYILTIRGTPQIYTGEEIAMQGGDDPDNRRDFPGGFAGDARNAFEKSGRTAAEQRMFEWTRDLLRLRREHAPLRRGRLVDLHFDDDSYAYARRDRRRNNRRRAQPRRRVEGVDCPGRLPRRA